MSRNEHARRWRAAYAPLMHGRAQHAPGNMSAPRDKRLLGTVSDADREYFEQLGVANAAAQRATERPAGSLAVALERMAAIERNMGIDIVATAREHWPDRDSHMAFLAAVKEKIAVAGTSFGMDGSRD